MCDHSVLTIRPNCPVFVACAASRTWHSVQSMYPPPRSARSETQGPATTAKTTASTYVTNFRFRLRVANTTAGVSSEHSRSDSRHAVESGSRSLSRSTRRAPPRHRGRTRRPPPPARSGNRTGRDLQPASPLPTTKSARRRPTDSDEHLQPSFAAGTLAIASRTNAISAAMTDRDSSIEMVAAMMPSGAEEIPGKFGWPTDSWNELTPSAQVPY